MHDSPAHNSSVLSQPFSWKRVVRWTLLCGAAVVAAFGVHVATTDCNGFRQRRNTAAAERHIDKVRAPIKSMPQYASVEFLPYTGGTCGCLLIRGTIYGQTDADRLRELVLATNPPTEVVFKFDRTLTWQSGEFVDNTDPAHLTTIPPPALR